MQKVHTVAVGEPAAGEGRVFRSIHSPDELMTRPLPEIQTLYDVTQYAAKTYESKNAIGYRTLTQMVEEEKEVTKIINGVEKKEKKMWKYFQLSGYTWLSYAEVADTVKFIGGGLRRLGLEKGSNITIYASTSANWMLMAHGCFTQSCTIVTAYDTLGEDGLLHSMNESEVVAIFTNADLLPVIQNVAGKCPTLKNVIYDGEPKPAVLDQLRNTYTTLRFSSIDELSSLGKEFGVEPIPPASTDLCCIMYTSGSTGNPKGVMLTHANIVATIAGVTKALKHHIQDEEILLAYLPLAHVLEFFVEQVCIFNGVALGYGSARTLTDASVRNSLGDIRELRPTLMTGVPAVWESIRKGILSKVHASSAAAQKVFNAAYKAKGWLVQKRMPTTLLDTVVFDKIKQQTGGRLRFAISGGAPISRETQEFLTVTLCPVLQGYGMTESCGMCTILTPEQFGYGAVGAPVACTEIKLVDVPEAGYTSANTPRPQGEIWIRGPCIATGYYKNEQMTKETFTEDGWLQTGDIGEWHSDGTLFVIDRKKNLVKLSNGEYVALEKLESVYKSCLYVSNIMVYADSLQARPVAFIYPVEQQLVRLAKEKGITNLDFNNLCEDKEINAVVLESLIAQAKKAGLKPAELLAAVELVPDEWTAQNGLLTAAQKLKRKDLVNKYKSSIDKLYGGSK